MKEVLRIAIPLTLWLVSFSAVYALHGVICGAQLAWLADPAMARTALISAWLVAVFAQLAVLIALLHPRLGGPPGVARWIAVTLAVAALVAAIWTLFPVAVLSLCGQPA
jgi:hypothetical protein